MTRRMVIISKEVAHTKTQSRIQRVGEMDGRLVWLKIGNGGRVAS